MNDMDKLGVRVKDILIGGLRAKEKFISDDANIKSVSEAASVMADCCRKGNKIIVFGNGGSAADSQHIAAELQVRFEKERKALPCIALTTDTSIITAAANDYDFNRIFSRQVEALCVKGDVALAISTSGNSANVIEGVKAARKRGAKVVCLGGKDGGKLAGLSDISVIVKEDNTARIQEVHGAVIHAMCKIIEDLCCD